jgi:hypothetical protein
VAGSAWLCSGAQAGPKIEVEKPNYEFGTIYQEETVEHEFVLENRGDAPLKIEKVLSTCGCAAALPSEREIAPGKRASLKVTFRSGHMRDRVTKHIYVDSNDPAAPRITLTLYGIIKVEVETVPAGLYLGSIQTGQTIEREVLVKPVEAKNLRLLEVRSTHQAVKVGKPEPLDEGRGGYRIKVTVGPLSRPERLLANIMVKTNLEHAKDLRILVYGKVQDQKPSPPPRGP